MIAVIIVIQLIPSGRPEAMDNNPGDLLLAGNVSDSVTQMLKTSCYDCHSNQTGYPWYAYVAPVSWLVTRDVKLGRESLNFSKWEDAGKMQKAKFLSNIVDEVEGKEMPMRIYTIMHPGAKLSEAERQALVDWANTYGESLFE